MNIETTGLMALSHDTYVEYTGDYYEEIRSRLDNRLGGLALAAVNEADDAISNRQLLRDLVGVLPQVDDYHKFHVETHADVRWLQNSVIWTDDGLHSCVAPYYIIGELSRGPRTSLLLHQAKLDVPEDAVIWGPETTLMVADMSKKDYVNMKTPTKDNLGRELSLDEVNELYDEKTGCYVVDRGNQVGNMMITSTAKSLGVFGMMQNFLANPTNLKVVENLSKAIHGLTFSEFRVIDQINHLSSAFECSDETRAVYSKMLARLGNEQLTLFE